MPDHNADLTNDLIERLEWHDSKRPETPHTKARAVTRRAALAGGAGAIGALMLGNTPTSLAAPLAHSADVTSIFGPQKAYHFVFVNHVTTNPFFVPTQYGIADACSLLGCTSTWTGSTSSSVPEMVTHFNSAIASAADGIAVSLIDLHAFNGPTATALAKGIPVVSYNADAAGNARLAYIGQDLFVSGQLEGQHIRKLVPSGSVALFIATPGSLNIQPRINGAIATLKGTATKYTVQATGAAVPGELTTIEAFWRGHTDYKGLFAVDAGSTQSCFQTIQKFGLKGKVAAGGYDLTPITESLLAKGFGQFTIDQQPYLQGFLPIIELFLYKASKGLTGTADIDTGIKFLGPSTIVPYSSTTSRFEGTGSAPGVH
jgi:simple sugar transport system substrate-binding protein